MSLRETIATKTLERTRRSFAEFLRPPPPITVSEWADAHRVLPPMSAEPGKWRTSRMPFLKKIMDCLSATSAVERVVFMKGTQVGGTEVGLNWIGYIIANTPGMAMLVMPSMDTIKRNTRGRIDPMIEATPELKRRVPKSRPNEAGNTLTSKRFRGGELVMTGSNAAAALRSTPVRYLFLDEVDAYPMDVDGEGDPVDLAVERTATYEGMSKVLMVSTPTIADFSRIEAAFKEGDQQYVWVPCPHCEEFQRIVWARIKWPEGKPRAAYMACEHCGGVIEEHQKPWMLERGEWRAERETDGTVASFHLSTLYSPQRPWGKVAQDFLTAKGDPPRLKTWVNTKLGETWREAEKPMEPEVLMARSEDWGDDLPEGVVLITVGVDTQDDRLEAEIVGWGKGEESWSLDYVVLPGSPASTAVWADLDRVLATKWHHPHRGDMGVSAACVDSGGHFSGQVLAYCGLRQGRRVWAIKGASGQGKPPFPRLASKSKKEKQPLYVIGVDTLKETFARRLSIERPADYAGPLPGYAHFPDGRDLGWFQQLVSEQLFVTYVKGRRHQEWRPKTGARNEAHDARIYAMAALEGLKMRGVWRAVQVDQFERKRVLVQPEADEVPTIAVEPPRPQPKRAPERPGFLQGRPSFGRPSFFR